MSEIPEQSNTSEIPEQSNSEISEKMRYILQFHFDRGDKPTQTCENICAVYGPDTVTKLTVQRWFARFRKNQRRTKC